MIIDFLVFPFCFVCSSAMSRVVVLDNKDQLYFEGHSKYCLQILYEHKLLRGLDYELINKKYYLQVLWVLEL